MSEFDQAKFKKKLKKKIAKKVGKYGKAGKSGNIQIGSKGTGPFYFLGFIGSAVYFISTASDFWDGVLGILKSVVWPAFLVFEAFSKLLG
ncbi:MAG: hypothetical protein RLZZ590_145 [Actinomycetota bacterium]